MKKVILLVIFISVSLTLYSQNLSWSPVNLDVGVHITKMMQDSTGRLIVQSEKGIFLVTNLSSIQRIDTLLNDSIKITCMAIDTNSKIYAGTYKDGVFVLDDNQNKWIPFSKKLENQNIRNIAISCNNDIVVATTNLLIYQYSISDSSWKQINGKAEGNLYFSILKYDSYNTLYASYSSRIYRLKYQQANWEYIFDNQGFVIHDIYFFNNDFYIATANVSIYLSIDSCKTWRQLYEGFGINTSVSDILIPNEKEKIITTYGKGIFYSNNDVGFFEKNNTGLPTLNITTAIILNNGKILANLDSSGLYISNPPKNIHFQVGQWIKKDQYYEQSAVVRPITSIKMNSINDKIYTNSNEGSIRCWNLLDGKLVKLFNYVYSGKSINSDKEQVITTSHAYGINSDTLNIIDINSNKTTLKTVLSKPDKYLGWDMYSLASRAFYSNKNNLIAGWCENGFSVGGVFNQMSSGVIDIFDATTGSLYKNLTKLGKANSVAISNDEKNFAFSSYTSYISYRTVDEKKSFSNYYIDSNFVYHPFLDSIGKPFLLGIYNIQFSNDSRFIQGLVNGSFYIWKTSDMKLYSVFSTLGNSDYSYFLTSIRFTDDSKRLIMAQNATKIGYQNPSYSLIQLLDLHGNIIRDSIFVSETNFDNVITTIDNSSKFLVGGTDGILRLFDQLDYDDVEESEPKEISNEINIFPNPATDYIQINIPALVQLAVPNKVEIYDILGVPYTPPNPLLIDGEQLRLDISGFVPGVYFVKIEDRVQRFVKM